MVNLKISGMENFDDDKATAKPLFGEELLVNDGSSDDLGNSSPPDVSSNYVDTSDLKKVTVELTGLKQIMKLQADREFDKEIRFRGNNKARGKLISISKLDEKPSLDIPPLASQKRGGPGKSRIRGAITTALNDSEALEPYSVREIMVERRKRMFLTALRRTGGNISRACSRVGLSRNTISVWMRSDDIFREEMLELAEAITDAVEDELMKRIAAGDTYAIIFYLKTMGRKRGYTEKIEIDGVKDEYDKMSDDELLREHRRLETKIKGREGDS